MRRPASVTFAVLLAASLAGAEAMTLREGGLRFEVPAGWTTRQKGEFLSLVHPDGKSFWIQLWAPHATFATANTALVAEIERLMEGVQWEKDEPEGKLNGMRYVQRSGSARMNGEAVEFTVAALDAKKAVFIVFITDPGGFEKHREAVRTFRDSLRRID